MLEAFGAFFVLLMFIKYSVKALKTVPESLNPGNIIPHILAFKVGALLLFPTYLEYVQFCSGFMYADFPWLNSYFGDIFGSYTDATPLPFLVFYVNMNLGSMYMLASAVVIVFMALTLILGKLLLGLDTP